MKTLSILIPVYNEKYTVEEVVDEVSCVALPEGMGREIIVIDDASTDGTSVILDALAASHPGLKIIHHEKNQGKGAAIRTGVRHVTGDVVVVQDADLEYSPSDYGRLLKPIMDGHADVVFGSRFLPSDATRVLYFWHSVGNRFLTLCSNMLTDLNLTDMETCFKMARAEIVKSIPIRSERFGIEPELTAKFAKRGCRIYEVPVSYRGRTYQEGKKITWKDGCKAFFVMLWFKVVDDLYTESFRREGLGLMATHRFYGWLAAWMRPLLGERVIEFNAANGELSRHLLPREYFAMTASEPASLALLENLFARNRRVTVMSMSLTAPRGLQEETPFDTAVCVHGLAACDDDAAALRTMCEALRPGGKLLLVVPQHAWLRGSLDVAAGHCRRYGRVELCAKLEAAGFSVESVDAFNRLAGLVWWINGRLLGRRTVGKIQLKLLDLGMGLRRVLDPVMPGPGLLLKVVALRKDT